MNKETEMKKEEEEEEKQKIQTKVRKEGKG